MLKENKLSFISAGFANFYWCNETRGF